MQMEHFMDTFFMMNAIKNVENLGMKPEGIRKYFIKNSMQFYKIFRALSAVNSIAKAFGRNSKKITLYEVIELHNRANRQRPSLMLFE